MSKSEHNGLSDQRKAALKRHLDAKALFSVRKPADESDEGARHPHGRGAMYLGGYAIECKLKAIAMEIYRCRTLKQLATRLKIDEREVYTHGLEALARRLSRLFSALRASRVWQDFSGQVRKWRPSWRYDPSDCTVGEAGDFLESVDRVFLWLDSNRG